MRKSNIKWEENCMISKICQLKTDQNDLTKTWSSIKKIIEKDKAQYI